MYAPNSFRMDFRNVVSYFILRKVIGIILDLYLQGLPPQKPGKDPMAKDADLR
jgi:hypothetical protein